LYSFAIYRWLFLGGAIFSHLWFSLQISPATFSPALRKPTTGADRSGARRTLTWFASTHPSRIKLRKTYTLRSCGGVTAKKSPFSPSTTTRSPFLQSATTGLSISAPVRIRTCVPEILPVNGESEDETGTEAFTIFGGNLTFGASSLKAKLSAKSEIKREKVGFIISPNKTNFSLESWEIYDNRFCQEDRTHLMCSQLLFPQVHPIGFPRNTW